MTKNPPGASKKKPPQKPKLTDTERHSRFVDMAHDVEADESPEAFNAAFDRLIAVAGKKKSER